MADENGPGISDVGAPKVGAGDEDSDAGAAGESDIDATVGLG